MRIQHELEKGVVCERCLKHTTKEEGYKRINASTPIVEDSTGKYKVIHRMNLCASCYKDYREMINKFVMRGNTDG
jgi:hypothetical protein